MKTTATYLLSALALCLTMTMSVSCGNSGSKDQETIGKAERDLYTIYYDPYFINHPDDGYSYSDSMMSKFKALDITANHDNPYSDSFAVILDSLERISDELTLKTGELAGFDGDILWNGQGDVLNFNLEIIDAEVKDDDHVVLKTKFTNGSPVERTFSMVRENGSFRIDDIDDLRKEAETEIASCRKYLEEYSEKMAQNKNTQYIGDWTTNHRSAPKGLILTISPDGNAQVHGKNEYGTFSINGSWVEEAIPNTIRLRFDQSTWHISMSTVASCREIEGLFRSQLAKDIIVQANGNNLQTSDYYRMYNRKQ